MYIQHIFFIHSSVDGHLSCFRVKKPSALDSVCSTCSFSTPLFLRKWPRHLRELLHRPGLFLLFTCHTQPKSCWLFFQNTRGLSTVQATFLLQACRSFLRVLLHSCPSPVYFHTALQVLLKHKALPHHVETLPIKPTVSPHSPHPTLWPTSLHLPLSSRHSACPKTTPSTTEPLHMLGLSAKIYCAMHRHTVKIACSFLERPAPFSEIIAFILFENIKDGNERCSLFCQVKR